MHINEHTHVNMPDFSQWLLSICSPWQVRKKQRNNRKEQLQTLFKENYYKWSRLVHLNTVNVVQSTGTLFQISDPVTDRTCRLNSV